MQRESMLNTYICQYSGEHVCSFDDIGSGLFSINETKTSLEQANLKQRNFYLDSPFEYYSNMIFMEESFMNLLGLIE